MGRTSLSATSDSALTKSMAHRQFFATNARLIARPAGSSVHVGPSDASLVAISSAARRGVSLRRSARGVGAGIARVSSQIGC